MQLNETMKCWQNACAEHMNKLREYLEMSRSPIHKQMQRYANSSIAREVPIDEATLASLLRWLMSHPAA